METNVYKRKQERMEVQYEMWYNGAPTNPLVIVSGYNFLDVMFETDGLIDAWATSAETFDLELVSFKKVNR